MKVAILVINWVILLYMVAVLISAIIRIRLAKTKEESGWNQTVVIVTLIGMLDHIDNMIKTL